MIMNLTSYTKYKDSGVEWLGNVPAHWDITRISESINACVNGVWGSEPDGINDLPCVRVADFDRDCLRVNINKPTIRAIMPSERQRRILKSGDLLLEKSGGGDLSPVGAVMLFDHTVSAVCSNFISRVSIKDGFDSTFLVYFHYALYSIRLNTRSIKQTTGIQNLDSSAYLSERVAFPPLPEQAAIVRYLDYVERRIQRYAGTKRKLLGLLAEQKQAIIHHAVTRGLDPDVPLKPSSIEWLGDVPAHWEVTAIKRFYSIQLGKMLQNHAIKSADMEVPYLKAQHVQWFSVRSADAPKMWANRHDIEQFGISEGDLLVCEGGEGGRCGLIRESLHGYIIQNALHRIRPLHSSSNNYLEYVLGATAAAGWFNAINNKATIAHFTKEKCGSLEIPFPHLSEQTAIVEYLDKITAKIDAVIARAHREIELISEYRTRLIADVVTGKVDVREAAAKLPDEADADDVMPDSDTDGTLDSDTTFDEAAKLDMVAEPDREY